MGHVLEDLSLVNVAAVVAKLAETTVGKVVVSVVTKPFEETVKVVFTLVVIWPLNAPELEVVTRNSLFSVRQGGKRFT